MHNLKVVTRKHEEKKIIRAYSTKCLTSTLQKCQIMTDKRRLSQTRGEARNCHTLKKTPKAQLRAEKKRTLDSTLVKMSIACSLVNNITPMLLSKSQ